MEKHSPKLVWRDILWRPSVAVVGFVFATVPLLTWGRDEFLSPATAEKWKIPKLLPHWPWWSWALLGLVVLLFTILNASSNVILKYENQADALVQNAEIRLKDEIAKRVRPEVIPICNWKRNEHKPIERNVQSLILKTLTDTSALDVKVQDIVQATGTASFRVIGLIPGKADAIPYCEIGTRNTSYAMWDLFTLVKYSCIETEKKMSEIEIPIVVDYRDAHGTWYQSLNVLRYDWFLGTGEISNTGFRKKL